MVTNLTLVLTFAAVVIVNILMRCAAERTNNRFGNISAVAAFNGSDDPIVTLQVIFNKECIILFCRFKYDRHPIDLKLLIFRRIKVIKRQMFQRNKFNDKGNQTANYRIIVLI